MSSAVTLLQAQPGLTATPVWTVAKSEEEAPALRYGASTAVGRRARTWSISTIGTLADAISETREGDEVSVEIPVRNLGSVAADRVRR